MLSCSCGTRDNLNMSQAGPSAAHWERHVDVCLTLLAQLITLLGVHYLLEGELALRLVAFFS